MTDLFKNFFKNFSSPSPLLSIINSLQNSPYVKYMTKKQYGEGMMYAYLFDKPVNIIFTLHSSGRTNQCSYDNVSELILTEIMNSFVKCKVVFGIQNGEKEFYIMNDVYEVELEIRG